MIGRFLNTPLHVNVCFHTLVLSLELLEMRISPMFHFQTPWKCHKTKGFLWVLHLFHNSENKFQWKSKKWKLWKVTSGSVPSHYSKKITTLRKMPQFHLISWFHLIFPIRKLGEITIFYAGQICWMVQDYPDTC